MVLPLMVLSFMLTKFKTAVQNMHVRWLGNTKLDHKNVTSHGCFLLPHLTTCTQYAGRTVSDLNS